MPPAVVLCGSSFTDALSDLFLRYRLRLKRIESGATIPGSYWSAPEAGLIADQLFVRDDTPVHSALHEACHYICMSDERRARLHTDAGGGDDEETAVCFLQALLADRVGRYGREQLFADMDSWGYSFRLGSAKSWFEEDASAAPAWLQRHGIIDSSLQPTWLLRQS